QSDHQELLPLLDGTVPFEGQRHARRGPVGLRENVPIPARPHQGSRRSGGRAQDLTDQNERTKHTMTKTTSLPRGIRAGATTLLIAGFGLGSVGTSFAADVIRVKGSDTMVQLASGWAEAYHKVKPGVQV